MSICQILRNAPAPWAAGRRSRRLALPNSEFYIFSKCRGTAAEAVNTATVSQIRKSQHYSGCICIFICSRALIVEDLCDCGEAADHHEEGGSSMGGFSAASTSPFDGEEDLLSDPEGPATVRADTWCAAEYVSFEFQIFAMLEPRPTNSQATGGTAQTPATDAQARGSSTCKMEKQMLGKVYSAFLFVCLSKDKQINKKATGENMKYILLYYISLTEFLI